MAEEPPGFTSQKSYLGIEKVQIKCFNFSILGWGLRVTYNSEIFQKFSPPPMGFHTSEFECIRLVNLFRLD